MNYMRLDALHIEKFRGISDLSLDDFQDVNLLLGGNDTGKTSVLEAITLFEMPEDIPSILRASRLRLANRNVILRDSYTVFESFLHLFPFSDTSRRHLALDASIDGSWHSFQLTGELVRVFRPPFRINANGNRDREEEEREITAFEGVLDFNGSFQEFEIPEDVQYRLTSQRAPWGSIEYIAPGQHLLGVSSKSVFRSKTWELQTVELLHTIDPEIEGIKLVPSEYSITGSNQMIEHRRYGEIPLYTYGDGMKKIVSLASILPGAKGGILMIDEIETSLQQSNLSKVFEWLLDACRRYDIQLFVTTHSLEAISTLAYYASNHPSELACYRLEKYNGYNRARRYSERMLDNMVNGSGLDVR